MRTWTDDSGKFEIQAKYVGRTKTRVLLKMDTGRDIKIPTEKLSQADQALIDEFEKQSASDQPSENPFE